MKKIAILACLKANNVCAGCSCMKAFYEKTGSFARYGGEEIRLTAFMRCSHCMDEIPPMEDRGTREKLDRLASEGTEVVHVGVCAMKRESGDLCLGMQYLVEQCRARGMDVVMRTH